MTDGWIEGMILTSRIVDHVREKYGQRLEGVTWDERARMRFLRTETLLMLGKHFETEEFSEVMMTAALAGASETLFGDPVPVPLANVIDLDSRRHRT